MPLHYPKVPLEPGAPSLWIVPMPLLTDFLCSWPAVVLFPWQVIKLSSVVKQSNKVQHIAGIVYNKHSMLIYSILSSVWSVQNIGVCVGWCVFYQAYPTCNMDCVKS